VAQAKEALGGGRVARCAEVTTRPKGPATNDPENIDHAAVPVLADTQGSPATDGFHAAQPRRCVPEVNMKKGLDPEQSALLAEWLTVSRANPAPVTMNCPLAELMIALNSGLMGVTEADVKRAMEEMVTSIQPQRRTGPPTSGGDAATDD
jgi:hypothetical protein